MKSQYRLLLLLQFIGIDLQSPFLQRFKNFLRLFIVDIPYPDQIDWIRHFYILR